MTTQEGRRGDRTDADLADLDRDELVRLGLEADHVELVHREDPFPVPGTRAEKRTERAVAAWFVIAGLAALGGLAVFLFWPWEYEPPGSPDDKHLKYQLYTPLLGILVGVSVFAIGAGAISYAKNLLPHETAVQQRHIGPSPEFDRKTTTAILADAGVTSGIGRRSAIKRAAGFALGVFGLGTGVIALGGLIKDPWNGGDDAALWRTGWYSPTGEKVYLRYDGHEIKLARPEDLEAGSIATVFPFKESERDDEEALSHAVRGGDNPVMLIRLRPDQGEQVIKRQDQEDFNYGDYYAYSKICTHLGCPASLYEAQTARLLCPCHQSQFNMLRYGKPIFGPATRPMPQLPIAVDEAGYFYARSDFVEAVGPAFWERRS